MGLSFSGAVGLTFLLLGCALEQYGWVAAGYPLTGSVCYWFSVLLVQYVTGSVCYWFSMLLVQYVTGSVCYWRLVYYVTR